MAKDIDSIEEFDHLFRGDPAGLAIRAGASGLEDRIQEWLATPEGTVADIPWWGNQLSFLKHEPQGVHLEVLAEMLIAKKLPSDIRNIVMKSVRVVNTEIDLVKILIEYQYGVYIGEVVL